MTCHHASLIFARKDAIDLYVVEGPQTLDVFTGLARTQECFWASRLHGRIEMLSLDQKNTPIPWQQGPLPEFCRKPACDARHQVSDLEHITYDIANAMNRVLQDRGFSRFVKKQIVGSWISGDSMLEFAADGTYRISGSNGPTAYSPPPEGRWTAASRMLCLMAETNDRGVRVALVSVNQNELRFHGSGGVLFRVYERT